MRSKVEFRGRKLSIEELRARRASEGERPVQRVSRNGRARLTVVKSISIRPELALRVARDIGDGNLSRGVVKAVTRYLRELDEERALARE